MEPRLTKKELTERWPGADWLAVWKMMWDGRLPLHLSPSNEGKPLLDPVPSGTLADEYGAYLLKDIEKVEAQHPSFRLPKAQGGMLGQCMGPPEKNPPVGHTYRGRVVSLDELFQRWPRITPILLEATIEQGALRVYYRLDDDHGSVAPGGECSAKIMYPEEWASDQKYLARELYSRKRLVFIPRDVEEFEALYPILKDALGGNAFLDENTPEGFVSGLRERGVSEAGEIAAAVDKVFTGKYRLSHPRLGAALAKDGEIKNSMANKQRGVRARNRAAQNSKDK
jgi:hypothetical protein